jgi:hypothetical protein
MSGHTTEGRRRNRNGVGLGILEEGGDRENQGAHRLFF